MGQDEVKAYKFDKRTQAEFIKDLTRGLQNEVKAINAFREIIRQSAVDNPEIVYVGSDKEGEIQFYNGGVANIDLFPDYLLKYKTSRLRARFNFIEVKVCNPHSEYAYFKKSQLEQFVEIGSVLILFVMGIATSRPRFILVSPESIINMGIEHEMIYGKETYKVSVRKFNWEKFIPVERKYSLLEKIYVR